MQMLTENLNLASAKPPAVGSLGELAASGLLESPYTIYNTIRNNRLSSYPEMFQEYASRWQYNFEIILGPANPAFVDATLDWDDMVRGLHLEYNENGVLTKVDSAGRRPYEEEIRTAEQNRVIEAENERTVAEMIQRTNFPSPNEPQILSGENAKASLSPKATYKEGFKAGINNKEMPEGLRRVVLMPEILGFMGQNLNVKSLSGALNALLEDGITVVRVEIEPGQYHLTFLRELKQQYDKILITTSEFERGRLEAEFCVDVLLVFGSISSSDQIDISKLSSTSKLFLMEYFQELR